MNTTNGVQDLELRIMTVKSTFAVGETVWLEIALRNTGSTAIKTLKYFMLPADEPDKNNLEIQVFDAKGNRISRVSHVMTGRALYYPVLCSIGHGETYRDSFQLAGTYAQGQGRMKVKKALWSLGENPEITSVNEYPFVTRGRYKVRVAYHVDKKHLVNLDEAESSTVWNGQVISNTLEISIK